MIFSAISSKIPSIKLNNQDIIDMIADANRASMSSAQISILSRTMQHLFSMSGSQTRYMRSEDEKAADLIINAGLLALASAELDPKDIDLLIYVGIGRGFLEPSTAAIFQDRLKLSNATFFDILDACASWVRAVHIAKGLIEAKLYRRIMILNGEFLFKDNFHKHMIFESLNELNHKFALFTVGEAATATILSTNGCDDEYYASFKSYGQLRNLCMIPFPNINQYNDSDGDSQLIPFNFYSFSADLLKAGVVKSIDHFYSDENIKSYTYDISFSHAASDMATEEVNSRCGDNKTGLYKTHYRYGNTISASVPLAMSSAINEGKLKHNDRVIIGMASAGLTTGWTRFRYMDK
jgi:3-oxoacyl-[acyl-carrier-protein] synthase III